MSAPIERLEAIVGRQRAWIASCGGDLAGYVTNYGSARDELAALGGRRYGEGGEAIYAADTARLAELEAHLAFLRSRRRDARYWCETCGRSHQGTSSVGIDHHPAVAGRPSRGARS